ncbi:Ig-like domain-containing protein [Myxococcota bacterium]|nr:Ig-like domain-containing protein [Myxococcota bacterium]
MILSALLLPTLLACNQGKLEGDCAEGQVLDEDGNCVDDAGDGGGTDGGGTDGGGTDGGGTDGGGTDGGGTDGGGTDGGTDGGTEDCDVDVDDSAPEDGDTDVALGSTVVFYLDDADPTASVSLATAAGASVAGSTWLANDDSEVWFQPEGPLSSNTEYVATLDWCGGTESVSFTTLDPGTPVDDLVGNAYLLDVAGASWTEPEGAGDLISGFIDLELIVGVSSVTGDSIKMLGAIADAGEQDYCTPTIDFPSADFRENPYFQVGPTDVVFDAGGISAELSDFSMSGYFGDDGDIIEEGVVQAELDVRVLAPALGEVLGTEDPDDLCMYMGFLGIECTTCTGDGADYCVGLTVEEIDGALLGESLATVDQGNCHPMCAESWDNPDCDTSGF